MIDEISSLISAFDVISFDIFDTLLLRPLMKPQDIWCIVEEEYGAEGFEAARRKADAMTYAAATARGGEHTIDEVYVLMGAKWSSFKTKELDCERRFLAANPEMLNLWNLVGAMGKKRVIISDMYVDEEWLKAVLRDNGIDGWDGFYLSSKVQKRKSTGELYKSVLRDFQDYNVDRKGSPVRFLHIGDNLLSDISKAEENGLVAVRYPKVAELVCDAFPYLCDFYKKSSAVNRSRIVGALAVGWHKYKCNKNVVTFWNKIGFMLGGVLAYSYVRWIIGRCKVLGIDHLMFVGRDGYIWQKIAREIAPEIKSDYFYAPRTISVRVLGADLNTEYADVCKDRRRFAEECNVVGEERNTRQRYEAYLKQFNIDPTKTALVDGMSSQFSAQRLVEDVIESKLHSFYLMAYSQPNSGEAYICSNNCGIGFQKFSEFLFGSPEAPIVDIGEDGPVFKKEIDPFEGIRMSACDEICNGTLECVRVLHKFDVLIGPQDWLDFYDAFATCLSAEDIANFEMARISTDVNHREYLRIVEKGPVFGVRWWTRGQRLKFLGRPIFRMRSFLKDGCRHNSLWLFGKIPILRRVRHLYSFAEVSRT